MDLDHRAARADTTAPWPPRLAGGVGDLPLAAPGRAARHPGAHGCPAARRAPAAPRDRRRVRRLAGRLHPPRPGALHLAAPGARASSRAPSCASTCAGRARPPARWRARSSGPTDAVREGRGEDVVKHARAGHRADRDHRARLRVGHAPPRKVRSKLLRRILVPSSPYDRGDPDDAFARSPRRLFFTFALAIPVLRRWAARRSRSPWSTPASRRPPRRAVGDRARTPRRRRRGDAGDGAPEAGPKKWTGPGMNPNQARIEACCNAMRAQAKTLGASPGGVPAQRGRRRSATSSRSRWAPRATRPS